MEDPKNILRSLLRNCILTYRLNHGLSQERMAEALHISPRSYNDQEHNRYGFSAMSMVYYLLLLEDQEILAFYKELRTLLKGDQENAA